jgi:hypothetical protein
MIRRSRRMAKKGKGLVVDFSNVDDSGGGKFNKRIKAGTYLAEFKTHKIETSQSGNTMITSDFELVGGDYDGYIYRNRFVLTEKALFNLFNFLKAAGKNPKKAKAKLNPSSWHGLRVGVDIADDEYENKEGKIIKQSTIDGFVPPDEVGKKKKSKDSGGKKKGKKSKKDDNDTVDSVDLDDEL